MDDLTATEGATWPPDVSTEWVVAWHEGGIVGYRTRDEAVRVARIYGYGTPESEVSVLSRTITVTYGAWTDDRQQQHP